MLNITIQDFYKYKVFSPYDQYCDIPAGVDGGGLEIYEEPSLVFVTIHVFCPINAPE